MASAPELAAFLSSYGIRHASKSEYGTSPMAKKESVLFSVCETDGATVGMLDGLSDGWLVVLSVLVSVGNNDEIIVGSSVRLVVDDA